LTILESNDNQKNLCAKIVKRAYDIWDILTILESNDMEQIKKQSWQNKSLLPRKEKLHHGTIKYQ